MLGRSAVHFLIAFIFKNSYIIRINVGGIYEIEKNSQDKSHSR